MEDKQHQDRLIGKLLFKIYRIKKKLGEGSFGKVYIAFNIETKESYAVKLVSKNSYFNFNVLKYYRKKEIIKEVY